MRCSADSRPSVSSCRFAQPGYLRDRRKAPTRGSRRLTRPKIAGRPRTPTNLDSQTGQSHAVEQAFVLVNRPTARVSHHANRCRERRRHPRDHRYSANRAIATEKTNQATTDEAGDPGTAMEKPSQTAVTLKHRPARMPFEMVIVRSGLPPANLGPGFRRWHPGCTEGVVTARRGRLNPSPTPNPG